MTVASSEIGISKARCGPVGKTLRKGRENVRAWPKTRTQISICAA